MKLFLSLLVSLSFSFLLTAQQYISTPINIFSYKKTAYVTLNSGEEVVGQLKGVKQKKGLFLSVTIKKEDGAKVKIPASDIKFMYLPQNDLDKISTGLEKAMDIKSYDEEYIDVNMEKLKEGYGYFESSVTEIRKNKESVALLQLLNPATSQKIKIYFDPFANESTSISVGGMKMAGGIAKSYFVKIGDAKAIRLKKKDYEDMFETLYGDCPSFIKSIENIKWSEFGEHVANYTKDCN